LLRRATTPRCSSLLVRLDAFDIHPLAIMDADGVPRVSERLRELTCPGTNLLVMLRVRIAVRRRIDLLR
jgi:hypothetical protein